MGQRGEVSAYPGPVSSNGRTAAPGEGESVRRALGRRKVLAVTLVVVPAILGALILGGRGGAGTPVLATAHALQPGTVIAASDLVTVNVTAHGSHVATVPAAQRSTVIGKTVAGPLSAGQLLAPSSLSSGSPLGANEVGMALALSPDQAAQGILAAGESVLIVSGQGQSGSGQALVVPARVLGILPPASSSSGQVVVDLALSVPAEAQAVATAAASTAGVRLVVLPRGTNG